MRPSCDRTGVPIPSAAADSAGLEPDFFMIASSPNSRNRVPDIAKPLQERAASRSTDAMFANRENRSVHDYPESYDDSDQ